MMLYESKCNYLKHHGILGQRWGVRRFQNLDGSLTPEGRERYLDTGDIQKKEAAYKEAKKSYSEIKNSSKVSVEERNSAEAKADFLKKDLQRSKTLDKINKTKLSSYQKAMRKKYEAQGMSEEDAAVAAYRKAQRAKIMAAAAGIAVAAIGVSVAYKHWEQYGDRVIKTGTTLQRITGDENGNFDRAFYASYDKTDKRKYLGLYGGGQLQMVNAAYGRAGADVYKLETDVGDTMRAAGRKAAIAALNEELARNSEMRSLLIESIRNTDHQINLGWAEKNSALEKLGVGGSGFKPFNKTDYDILNSLLVYHDDTQQKVTDMFYSALKKKGYSAVLDVNDQFYSGYEAKAPVIVFDSEKLTNPRKTAVNSTAAAEAYRDIVGEMRAKAERKEFFKGAAGMLYNPYLVMAGIAVASAAGSNSARIAKTQKDAIANYKKEHPNSKLSDQEILENIYGEE